MIPDSPFVVRVAGLPASVLDDLRCPVTQARLEDAAELSHWLRVEAGELSDALYDAIGDLTEANAKPRLVALRRAVFGGRCPNRLLDEVGDVLPAELADRIRHWSVTRSHRERLTGELPATLAAESAEVVPVLRELAAHPDLRRGLVIASPSLYTSVSRWLAEGGSRLPSRRVLSSLMRYVTRMATKTSPLTTFTLSGLGRWENTGVPVRHHGGTHRHTVVKPQVSMATTICESLAGKPGVADRLHLRVNPSVVDDGRTLRFLTSPPNNSVISLRATEAVRRLLTIVRAHEDERVDAIRALLAEDSDGVVLAGLLARLCELGAIERYVPVPDQSADVFGDLVAWLENTVADGELSEPDVRTVKELAGLHVLADRYAAADDPDARLGLLTKFRSGVQTLAAGFGGQPTETDVRSALHENVHIAGTAATCDPRQWQPIFDDLGAVVTLLSAFDTSLPLRLALADYVGNRRIPFLSLYHALNEQARDPLAQEVLRRTGGFDDSPDTTVGEVRRLRTWQSRIVEEFGAREHIAPEEIFRDARSWPSCIRKPSSVAVYGQLLAGDDPRLVVNAIGSGHGRGRSTVLGMLGEPALRSPAPRRHGVVFAEFDQLFGLDLNTRVSELDFAVDLPGHVSHRPRHERIPLGELVVAGDPETGTVRLLWPRQDVEVRPVHTGMMADNLLPPAVRLLVRAFGETGYLLHSRSQLHGRSLPAPDSDEVVRTPRLEIGRVVLRRASWAVRRQALPAPRRDADDSLRMLRIREWLRANDIPQRSFVRVIPAGAAQDLTSLFAVSRKPMYVDFTNWFLFVAFERALDTADSVIVFSEVLPDPAEETGRVSEFLFNLTDLPDRGRKNEKIGAFDVQRIDAGR